MSGQPEVGYVELLRGNIQFRAIYTLHGWFLCWGIGLI